jgi:hypothetical protein
MPSANENTPPSSILSLNWISLAIELYRGLEQFLKGPRHEGIYEILEYDCTLELIDPKGDLALLKKRQRVRFLQDNVIAFQDLVWGEGRVLVDYDCSPGTPVDRYQNGDRWNVLISLRETKSSGDIEEFFIQRRIKRGFTQKEEWWQTEMQHQTRWLRHCIIFPKKRRCQRAVLVEKTKNRTTVFSAEHFADLPDGRQILTWENKKPRRFETYTIQWRW